jgi:2-(1,2-epoxy-1,2-dihydrophenyl)acetyl-CoA isomerase
MAFEFLKIDTDDAGIATMTLNRPDKLNAYNQQLEQEMCLATEQIGADTSVRALVVTGEGRAFSAGGDVSDMVPGGGWDLGRQGRYERFKGLHQVALNLQAMPKPTIAMINGFAVGAGCNLALACDIRVSSAKARFGLAFVNVGLGDDMGGAWFLPRLVGVGKALELYLSGAIIDAEEALRIGLVNQIVEPEDLRSTTYELAGRLAHGATHAQGLIKETIYKGMNMSLAELLDFEAERQVDEMYNPDHQEGVTAFLEKRDAKFEGSAD